MVDELVLHIGQPKTATTSLQHALARNRVLLRDNGVTYPASDGRDAHHFATYDLLMAHPGNAYLMADDRRRLENRRPMFAGAWSRLLDELAVTEGRAVVSCEGLCYLSPVGVSRALADLRAVVSGPVRVVITHRQIDELLVSAYQQYSKYDVQEPLPAFVTRALVNLTSDRLNEFSWMSLPHLRACWDSADEVVGVAVRTADSAALEELVEQVVGFRLPVASQDRRNVSTSLVGLLAWRMFMIRHPNTPPARGDRVRIAVYRSRPVAMDRSIGGSVRISQGTRSWIRAHLDQGEAVRARIRESEVIEVLAGQSVIEMSVPPALEVRESVVDLYRRLQGALTRDRARGLPSALGRRAIAAARWGAGWDLLAG